MTAAKLLQNTLSKLAKEPVEGFVCELLDESNLFKWRVFLEGPKDSPYEGGIFQLLMEFPDDYPMSPPTLKFTSSFWHPNVYEDGKVCISILHPPGDDPMSGELPQERWLPTQSVATIMLSVISMLNDPNISSPANVDASVEWRRDRAAYNKRCKELAERSRNQAPPGLVIPHPDSDPVERQKAIAKMKEAENEDLELYSYGDDFEESDAEAEEDDGDLEDEEYNESDEEVEEDEEEASSLKRKAEDTDNDLKKKKKDQDRLSTSQSSQ
eukprot:TRINITY_DN2525_c0_g1_i3.p1 TRINITY_DN2525_c0_g1~~TRINITY_DN2525_c0_g1_i3.p1  ORF type:complete len:269 (-),score=57.69 TRINITY_DN2525_c0_g1_i3:254-1060(-)